jgi:hypothetical protein
MASLMREKRANSKSLLLNFTIILDLEEQLQAAYGLR